MKLSEKITWLRRQRGWSQEALAERLNVTRQSVSKWESGASIPELDRIVAMCELFGLSADALIREDILPDGAEQVPEIPACDPDHPLLTLDDAYAYVSQYQIAARKVGLGVLMCVASPAPITALSGVSETLASVFGVPVLLLLVALAVCLFITSGTSLERYKSIEKGRFTAGAGVTEWAREAQEHFRPALTRDIAVGVALCILSPIPCIVFADSSEALCCLAAGFLLLIVALACYLFVRSGMLQSCYRRLLKEKD